MDESQAYKCLDEIRKSKKDILDDIRSDGEKIQELWISLFRKEETRDVSPTKRFVKILNMGAEIFDGAMLGWKLYRKFGRYKQLRRR